MHFLRECSFTLHDLTNISERFFCHFYKICQVIYMHHMPVQSGKEIDNAFRNVEIQINFLKNSAKN